MYNEMPSIARSLFAQRGRANNGCVRCLWRAPLLAAVLALWVIPVQAATFAVNHTADVGDSNLGDGKCEVSVGANIVCTLRAAIQQANNLISRTDSSRDTNIIINIQPGTFPLTGAAREDGAVSGDLDILGTCPNTTITNPCLTIIGAGVDSTIINADFKDRAFHMVGRNTVKITGVTIRQGQVLEDSGGSIKNTNGWVTLENCSVTGSRAGSDSVAGGYGGGAIYNGENARMVINNCVISDNQIFNFDAQGVNAFVGGGGIFNSGILTLKRTTVEFNKGRPFGAGIQNSKGQPLASGVLNVEDSIVRNNTSSTPSGPSSTVSTGSGGGISNHGGAVTLTRAIVRANKAIDGGGVYNVPGVSQAGSVTGSLRVISSVIDANIGGGIFNQGSADIIYSTISANAADGFGVITDGGGIHNRAPGSVIVTNSTLTGNTALRHGGGIFNGRTMTLTNVTLSKNTAGAGNEYFASVDPNGQATPLNSLQNTIIGDNDSLFGAQRHCMKGFENTAQSISPGDTSAPGVPLITSLGHNLERGNSCGLNGFGDLPNTSPDFISPVAGINGSVSPDVTLLDNTVPLTLLPLPTSAAIGRIPPELCATQFDQRQHGRPGNDGRCDIGAVETDGVVAPAKVDVEVAMSGNPATVSLGDELTYTLTVTNRGPGTAAGVTLTTALPAGTAFMRWSASPENTTVAVTCGVAVPVVCSLSPVTPTLASGASFTVFIVARVDSSQLSGTTIEGRASVTVASPADYLLGNNGSLTACVSGACVLTAVGQGNTNFGSGGGGGGAFGPLELLLLGPPAALLLRRRKSH